MQSSFPSLLRGIALALVVSAPFVWAQESGEAAAPETQAPSAAETEAPDPETPGLAESDLAEEAESDLAEEAESDLAEEAESDLAEEAESDLAEEEEFIDINELTGTLEPTEDATDTEPAANEEELLDADAPTILPDRPSARGVGGKKTTDPPAQTIETESVDTSQAEAEAERQRRLQEEEAEIMAKQKEFERRQRIERGLDEQIQDLKEEALLLGKELRLLSEKLIYPSSTQVTVFLSLKESDEDFLLDSVELKMNGRLVGSHLYTLREIDALRKGGVQRIFDGNLRAGEHSLELTVNGREDDEVETFNWRYDFSKGANPYFVELRVFQNRITAKSW